MSDHTEQILSKGSVEPIQATPSATLRLDPPIASSRWVLVRGRVELPAAPKLAPRRWWFGRPRRATRPNFFGTTLTVRLPDDEQPRSIPIGPLGEFEARFAARLPRLRSSRRHVAFSLRHQGLVIEQSAPLWTPSPGATRGVIVLAGRTNASPSSADRVAESSNFAALSEISSELTRLLAIPSAGADANPVFFFGLNAAPAFAAAAAGIHGALGSNELTITTAGAAGREPVEHAEWIARLADLFADELDFVVIADTGRGEAVLRALDRLEPPPRSLRAIFLSDTRAVARGILKQSESPRGIARVELPIVLCQTIDEARAAARRLKLVPDRPATLVAVATCTTPRVSRRARVTRYPIVFCHGMLGYSVLKLRQVDLANYFNGLREFLSERGFRVLMPQLGRTHGIAERAEQLRQEIGRWTAEPVNIIGHSMGGLDARFFITKLGLANRVASLTTIATPHHGSTFGDWFVEGFDSRIPFLPSLERVGIEVDGFRDVTRAACRAFNELVPDAPGVRYLSYSAFQVARKIPPVLRRSHSIIARSEGANDGLVSELSARWGQHQATVRADHLALVGERGPEHFDHLAFFSHIVDDLVRAGL